MDFKKFFLYSLIGALSTSALIGIIIFLVGEIGDVEIKILVTTLFLAVYSLTGLCCSIHLNKEITKLVAIAGIMVSVLGFFLTTITVWELLLDMDIWRTLFNLFILAFTLAHISLILIIKPVKAYILHFRTATIIFVSILAAFLIYAVVVEFDVSDFYFRLIGVFAILDALGTIITPILNRTTRITTE